MENKDPKPLREGDFVDFPKHHNSRFTASGELVVISGEYCRVAYIEKGIIQIWSGKLSELRKSYAGKKKP